MLGRCEEEVLGYRFGGDTEPDVVGHPDAFIITRPDIVALVPVSVDLLVFDVLPILVNLTNFWMFSGISDDSS
jgi:hypothetical protein